MPVADGRGHGQAGCGRSVLFLGAASYLEPSIAALVAAGFRVVSVDRDPDAPGHRAASVAAAVPIDDIAQLTRLVRDHEAHAIVPGTEAGVVPAALAGEACGLPGASADVARACTDKRRMRAAWSDAGLCQPDFIGVDTPGGIRAAIASFGLPLVLKPANAGGSRGVSVVLDAADIDAAVQEAVAVHQRGGFIIERYIEGPLITADGFVDAERAVVAALGDVETLAEARFRVNMTLNYPAAISSSQEAECRALVARAAQALGLRNAAFHCECIAGADGVVLVELAARGGGSYISSRIVEQVSGICAPVTFCRLRCGDAVRLVPRDVGGASLRFLRAGPGRLVRVEGLSQARTMPGIVEACLAAQPGAVVGDITHDNARPGLVLAFGIGRDQAFERGVAAASTIRFVLDGAASSSISAKSGYTVVSS